MNTQEMQEYIKRIITLEYGMCAFAVIKKDDAFSLKKFILDDDLSSKVTDMLKSILENQFLCDTAELDTAENIDDDRKVFYEIPQTTEYSPFAFLNSHGEISDKYSESDLDDLLGFAFKLNVNDTYFWIYQQVNYPQLIKKSKNIYAIISGGAYTSLKKDVLKIERKVDCLIIGSSIITNKIELLQRVFHFEDYVRGEAQKTIQYISEMEIVNGIDKFLLLADKKALTNAKKLYKAKNSPVLRMKKDVLLYKLRTLPRYRGTFEITEGRIQINNQKQATAFLKMLNDSILKSELTDTEYDSTVKKELEPIEKA